MSYWLVEGYGVPGGTLRKIRSGTLNK